MVANITELSSSKKFNWRIENFSKVFAQDGTYSDVFSVGGFKWKARIYPKEYHISICIRPLDLTRSVETEFSVAVTSQTDSKKTVRCEMKRIFHDKEKACWGWPKFMRLSTFYNRDKGYLVNDTCVVRIRVTCTAEEKSKDDVTEGNLVSNAGKTENAKQTKVEDEKSSSELGDYPGAGQPFGEGSQSNKGCFYDDEEYEDVGGFSILQTQEPLYKKIWLKYGHIPSSEVLPISSYSVLVMVLKDLMASIMDMYQCRYVDLSSETISGWEEKIQMAEKLKFNIGWLRERLETVKKGMGGMQTVKTELLEHGQPLRAAKEKVKILTDVMKKVEVQMKKAEVELVEAKANARENTRGLLSESDMEMYLEIGENLLLDGLF